MMRVDRQDMYAADLVQSKITEHSLSLGTSISSARSQLQLRKKKKSTGKTHVSLCANLNISLQMCGIQIITKKQKRKTMHMVCTHAIRRTCCLLSFPRLLYRPMLDREYTPQALCVPASFGQIPRSIVLEVMAVSLLPHPLVPLQLQLPIRPLIFLLEANKAFHHLR